MKTYTVLILGLALILSGCAGQNINTESGHTPVAPKEVIEADRLFLKKSIGQKMEGLALHSLHAVNKFIDVHLKNEALGAEIVVLSVERHDFPFFLEGVMRSNPLLNALPRSKERLVVVESERSPGVQNVFYTIHAEEVPEGKQIATNWAPLPEKWNKHVDPRVNLLEDRTPEQVFFTLFYEGNMRANPDLILSVRGQDGLWDWSRMSHPYETGYGVMLIPLATIKNGAMEALLKD